MGIIRGLCVQYNIMFLAKPSMVPLNPNMKNLGGVFLFVLISVCYACVCTKFHNFLVNLVFLFLSSMFRLLFIV